MRSLGIGLTIGLAACGGPGGSTGGEGIPCPSGNCGNATFRAAIPSRASVLVDFAAARARVASTSHALESLSPALVSVDEYVTDINDEIDDLFADIEELAQTTPELEEEDRNRWRMAADEDGFEEVLEVSEGDGVYKVFYWVGEEGFDPDAEAHVIEADVSLDGEDQESFSIVIDLDALAAADPSQDLAGRIYIDMMPFDDGERELWYDLEGVSVDGEPAETSITTYFDFGDDDGGLEYVMDSEDGEQATVYARWSPEGGRYDHHALVDGGDELMTNCWDADGAELFAAEAYIDDLGVDGFIDGDEADCLFGPVDGHPDPGEEFDDLPAEGEWDEMVTE